MNKKGKELPRGVVYLGVFALLVVAVAAVWMAVKPAATAQAALGTGAATLTPTEAQAAAFACGSTKQTTVSMSLKNGLNTSAAEIADANYVIYQIGAKGETQIASGSNLSGGQQTLDCGAKYRLKLLGGGNMNSRITGVYSQNGAVDTDGSVTFTTTSPTMTLGVVGSKHDLIQVRAYDEDARARVYQSVGADPNAFAGTGVEFTSTTDNATATTVTAGSSMTMTLELKNVNTVADYNDHGVYVLFDAANTYWDKVQKVTFDGVALTEVKSTLTSDESRKFSNYEFVYFIPEGQLIDAANHALQFQILKANGATGNDTLAVDFAVKTNYLSVDGFTTKTAAVKDSSTFPYVLPLFQTSFLTTT